MLSERIFPTFPSEILPENASTLAYGPYGTVAIASGSLINFAFISNQDKTSNNMNLKQIKPMFSISVGLNLVTALKFDTSKQLCADPILYIGDSAGNIFIYNYQKHEYLAVFSPNGHWKDDRYVHVQQIEIDYLPDSRILNRSNRSDNKNEGAGMEQNNNNFNKAYKNKNIIVLFKSKKIVSYSIIQDDDETYQLPISRTNSNDIRSSNSDFGIDIGNESNDINFTSTRNNSSNHNSFYKSRISNSIDCISSALNFTVNWVIDLENEMTNFSIDPFTNKKIFLYNKNKDNSFTILNLEEISGSFSSISSQTDMSDEKSPQNRIIPKIAFSNSLNKYDFKSSNNGRNDNFITPFNDTEIVVHRYSTIQCAQFSRHIQGYVYILTEHELILYSIDYDLFTRVNLTNQTLQKSAHFDKIIQFETDHRKILLVYKTGAIALFSLNSLFTLNNNNSSSSEKFSMGSKRRKRSVSDYKVSESPRRYSRMSDTSKDEEMRKLALKNEVQMNSKVHARDDHDVHIHNFESLRKNDNNNNENENESNGKGNFSFKAIFEVKQIVQSQQFVTCASPPFESERDDIIVFLYHPFGIALFDMSRMRIVSCCPLFSDKETCFSTDDKFVAYGSIQGNIRIRSIFDNSFFFSLHVLDEPIKFVGISRKKNCINNNCNGSDGIDLNGIRISFGSDKKIGEFCFDTRKLTVYRSPSSFSIKKVIGSYSGGLIVQRDDETAGVFVKGSEVFLSLPENDKIIDICFNENENENDENGVGQDEKGSFMVLRKNNIVELYKYNEYTKYSFTDNNYNCSSFNFLNNNKISNTASQIASNSNSNQNQNLGLNAVSAAAMKRRIIAHPVAASSGDSNINSSNNSTSATGVSAKGKEKEKETKFVESTCVSLSGVDFALGFNDGSVFLLKTDDQTFAKRVEVLSSVPIVQMKFCSKSKDSLSNNKLNRALFCLTGDRILCEVSLLNNEITSKVTLSHVQSFTIINSSFIMVKNATNSANSNDSMNNSNNNNNNSITNNNNNSGSNNSSAASGPSNNNITSISSVSNLSQINSINEEPKPNFYTPYDDDLIYPFPVLSKYKKNSRNRTRSILQEESSSSTEEKEKEQEVEEDSSCSILEKSLSFPILKEILRNFILNNPLTAIIEDIKSKSESNEIEESLSNRWFCLLPSIYDESTKTHFQNHILRNEGENCKSKIGLFGSPIHLPYQTDIGRDFWLLLLGRSCMRQECLYASGEGSLEYEVALSRILEGIASLSAPVNLNGSTIDRASTHQRITSPPSPLLKQRQLKQHQQQQLHQQQHQQQSISSEAREKKYRMELFYALVYAHRYDEATNVLTYNPESDTFMFNTILAAALLGFSEFDVDISSSQKENEASQKVDPNSVPTLKKLDDDSNSSLSLSMSAREQQYAVIKHAATQMIMLSTKTGRLVEGANLLRLSQLDSYAASILIQAGHVGLAMKFIRGMKKKSTSSTSKTQHHIKFSNGSITNNSSENNNNNNNENSGEKANFCYEIGAMCYKCKYYREASFFFLTANEYFLALHSFFMFALTNFGPILAKSKSKSNSEPFNVHYARAICDIFFIKFFLEETGLLVEPLLCEKEEVLRKKKFEKLGNNVTSPLLDLNTLKSEIDKEFKLQIQHLMIDESLFFKSS